VVHALVTPELTESKRVDTGVGTSVGIAPTGAMAKLLFTSHLRAQSPRLNLLLLIISFFLFDEVGVGVCRTVRVQRKRHGRRSASV